MRQVLGQTRQTDPIPQAPPTDVFQEHQRLAVDDLDTVCLCDVIVPSQRYPGLSGLYNTLGERRVRRQQLLCKSLRSVREVRFMVIDEVDDTPSTTLDLVHFPPVLDTVANMPERGHIRVSRY